MKYFKLNIGLGTFRFFLAFLVAISHLWEDMLQGPAAYSVWGFFVLSGFLMTLVLTKKYGLSAEGIKQYAHNRFLRIYPSYFICCIFGLIVLICLHNTDTTILNPAFFLPIGIVDILGNLFMVPFHFEGYLVPVAGALFTEVWAYMLMPFAATHKCAAWLGLIITFTANCNYGFDVSTFSDRYALFAPAIMGFFVGSICFHYIDKLKRIAMAKLSFIVWCIHACLWLIQTSYPWKHGIYISLICSAWVVISFFSTKSNATDKLLGDMSYLVYLLHTTVGMCVYSYFGARTIGFFTITFLLTLILSYIMVVYFERPLQKRFKIKPNTRQ